MNNVKLSDKILESIGLTPSVFFVFGVVLLSLKGILTNSSLLNTLLVDIFAIILFEISFVIWIVLSLLVLLRIFKFRTNFPYKKLGIDFFIINSKGGRVYLFDKKKKEIRWIKTWQTAIDLNFEYEWTDFEDINFLVPEIFKNKTMRITRENINFKLNEFKYGNPIVTRGKV